MNEVFKEYATSTAFAIALSKSQCHALLTEAHADPKRKGYPPIVKGQMSNRRNAVIFNIGTFKALEGRGLVHWHYREGKPAGFAGLTKAGWLMVDLLIEAGLTLENTLSLSARRTREYWGAPLAANDK